MLWNGQSIKNKHTAIIAFFFFFFFFSGTGFYTIYIYSINQDTRKFPVYLLCTPELLCLCRVVALKSLPVYSFNVLIIPILICNHFSLLLSLLSSFVGHVSWGGSVWDTWVAITRISCLMSAAAMCCGSWRLLCVRLGMLAVCRRLRINHFLLIVWILVLMEKLIAEMYVHCAL